MLTNALPLHLLFSHMFVGCGCTGQTLILYNMLELNIILNIIIFIFIITTHKYSKAGYGSPSIVLEEVKPRMLGWPDWLFNIAFWFIILSLSCRDSVFLFSGWKILNLPLHWPILTLSLPILKTKTCVCFKRINVERNSPIWVSNIFWVIQPVYTEITLLILYIITENEVEKFSFKYIYIALHRYQNWTK